LENLKIEKELPLFGFPEDKNDCAKLYNYLVKTFTDSKSAVWKDFCETNGYKEPVVCESIMNGILKTHFNKSSGDSLDKFISGYIAADAGRNVVQSYMAQAEKQIDVSNTMAAFQAEIWIPKLRSTTTVAVILLAPLCFLLIFFAPGGVVKWYGGMFVWLILWSGIDQLMYMKYQNDIYEACTAMRDSGLGVKDMLNIHYPLLEPLGMYGKMRWISMTLALAMCMGILKIGNHAMVSIADGIGQAMQQTASQTGAALSQIGGTDAAQDQFIREKARGWAAGMTDVRSIANTVELGYYREIANANALINSVGGGSAISTANRLANTDAYNALAGVNKVETQRELGLNAAESGSAEGLRAVGDYKALRSALDALGDINSYLNYRARQEGWNVEQAQAHMNKMSKFVGSDKDAAIFAAETSAMSSYLQGRGYQALGGAAGDFGAYVNNKTALDVNAYWQSIGIMASDKTQAAALGLSMDEFAEFRNNRFALNDVMAAKLNERYKTDEFTAGQTISFAINSDGGISNMTAQKTNFSGSVNGYDVQGANAAWTFGDNGGLLSESYSGLINGSQGSLLLDGEGNTIVHKGEYGTRYDNVFNAVLNGNSDPFGKAKEIYQSLKIDNETLKNLIEKRTELTYIMKANPTATSEYLDVRKQERELEKSLGEKVITSGYNAEVSALAISLNEGFGRYVQMNDQTTASWTLSDSLAGNITFGFKKAPISGSISYTKTYTDSEGESRTESYDNGIQMFETLTRYAVENGKDPAEFIKQGISGFKPFKP
jgi:hypothetical protein